MKNNRSNSINLNMVLRVLIVMLLAASMGQVQAQDKAPKSRMKLTVTQLDQGQYLLESLVRAKIDDRFEGLKGLSVDFFTYNDDDEVELGSATTDADGIAILQVDGENLLVDSTGLVIFNAVFDGTDDYRGSDTDAEIILASMDIETFEEKDDDNQSVKNVSVTLSSQGEPVPEATIFLYKEGMIRPLLIGEEDTDEDGQVVFTFPNDLPGDEEGNLNLFCKVDDNIDHGYMKYDFVENWGSPVMNGKTGVERTLSSPTPPLWLLITFLLLLVIIWGHYIEVIIKLIKVKKMAKVEG